MVEQRLDAIGASHYSSRVWFTVGHGILNEVYWPHVDRPQIRDLYGWPMCPTRRA